jgi:hypothetical protein
MNVGEASESAGQPRAHHLPPLEPLAPRIRSAWYLQDRVVDKEAHHRVQIMGVEGVDQALERLDGCLSRTGHPEYLIHCVDLATSRR